MEAKARREERKLEAKTRREAESKAKTSRTQVFNREERKLEEETKLTV